jgi:hypothetical protein
LCQFLGKTHVPHEPREPADDLRADSIRQTASMVLWTSGADTPGLSPIYALFSAPHDEAARSISTTVPEIILEFLL